MGYGSVTLVGPSYVATDDLIASNDALKVIPSASYTKIKSITFIKDVFHISTLRVSYDCQVTGGAAWVTVYKNGVAIGSEVEYSGGVTPFTADYEFTDLKVNDSIEIWAKKNDAANIQNFRIYGAETPCYSSLE